jgi:hypothetical protein
MKIRYYCPDCRKKSILNAIFTAEPRVCAWCGYPINPKHVQEQSDKFSRYYPLIRHYPSGYMNVFIDICFYVFVAGSYCFVILLVITHEKWEDFGNSYLVQYLPLACLAILLHIIFLTSNIIDKAADLKRILDRQRNPKPETDEENTTTDDPDQK